jgi:hypothetical protein
MPLLFLGNARTCAQLKFELSGDVEIPVRMLLLVGIVFLISACTGYTNQGEELYRRTGQESMLWRGYVCPCD